MEYNSQWNKGRQYCLGGLVCFAKVIFPMFLAWFLYVMFKPVFINDGVTDYFKVWLACGVPFGIWRLRVWLIPRGFDIGGTVGVWALNIIIGGLIGGVVVVWRLLVAVWYLILTIYRIVTFKSHIPVIDIPYAPASGEIE